MINVVFSLWVIPSNENISKPKVTAFIRQLNLSKRRPVNFTGLSGRYISPITSAAIPIGMLMAKKQCHEPKERIIEAIVGPAAVDMAMTRALMPIPRPRNVWDR